MSNTALLQGLLDDVSGFDVEVDQIELTGEITTVTANEFIETREAIEVGGQQHFFNVRYAFIDPILSSIILRKTVTVNNQEGRIDFNATVVAKRRMDVQVGDEWLDIATFACEAIRAASPTAIHLTDETILHTLSQYGWNPNEKLPMYLQHLGAGVEAFNEIAGNFVDLGAHNNVDQVRSRASGKASTVTAAYRHQEGIPVLSMEISKADRSKSATGAGFIGFFDATYGTLNKVIAAHRTRTALKQIIESPTASEQDKKNAAQSEVTIRNRFSVPTSARAYRNWGGTSEVVDPLGINDSAFYAQQVPCGRFTIGGLPGQKVVYSVWTNSNKVTAPIAAAETLTPIAELPTQTF